LQEIPIAELETLLTQESAGEIYKLGTALIKVIKKYQAVKESFSFSLDQARSDPDYIEGKMKELIERCRYFSTFSLFLFDQLERCYSLVAAEDPLLEKVRFIFAPLVERLQLIFLADDFRDRYLRITNPGKYGWIKENVIHSRLEMDYKTAKMYLRDFVAALREQLRQHYPQMLAGLSWIYWRVKSPFSIWNKVEVRRKYDYTKLRDILAVKITTKTLADLWKLAKILKHEFAVREEDIEDDITCPRESGWQALTIVVHDDQRRPIEIQLMTSEMNYRNTFVMAATWEYTLKRDLKTVGINRQNFASHINGLMCSDPEKNFHRLYDHWVGA
jgi:(p)ppGpp synthase/HD superfamily hydrolase